MRIITITGNVGRDPQRGENERAPVRLAVAVAGYDRREKAKTTTWYDVACWGRDGDYVLERCHKGDRVLIVGDEEVVERDGRTFHDVSARAVELLTRRSE